MSVARRIISVRIIGNAQPCRPSLRPNGLLNTKWLLLFTSWLPMLSGILMFPIYWIAAATQKKCPSDLNT